MNIVSKDIESKEEALDLIGAILEHITDRNTNEMTDESFGTLVNCLDDIYDYIYNEVGE